MESKAMDGGMGQSEQDGSIGTTGTVFWLLASCLTRPIFLRKGGLGSLGDSTIVSAETTPKIEPHHLLRPFLSERTARYSER